MLKLLGAVIIIASTTLGGFHIASSYHERPKQLRILQKALQILETEIVYGSIPLKIAMNHIGERIKGAVRLFFLATSKNLQELDGVSAFDCWQLAIEENFSFTSLKAPDKEILIHFGQTLGVSDKEDQVKHIRLAIENLAAEESSAREEQKIYEKLSKNLGVLLGILIVILIY